MGHFIVIPGKKSDQVGCLLSFFVYIPPKIQDFFWTTRISTLATCPHPKVYLNCSTSGTGELGQQCAKTCLNLDNDECVSVCVTPHNK